MIESFADQAADGQNHPRDGIIQCFELCENGCALFFGQPAVQDKTVFYPIPYGFTQQIQMVGTFRQNQNLSSLPASP